MLTSEQYCQRYFTHKSWINPWYSFQSRWVGLARSTFTRNHLPVKLTMSIFKFESHCLNVKHSATNIFIFYFLEDILKIKKPKLNKIFDKRTWIYNIFYLGCLDKCRSRKEPHFSINLA